MAKFECSSCGLCCYVPLVPDLPREFNRGDGYCIHLAEDMTCGIYEERPLACRVDESWDDDEQGAKMRAVLRVETREEMHEAMARGCAALQAMRDEQDEDQRRKR